jgi:hypothetical protein
VVLPGGGSGSAAHGKYEHDYAFRPLAGRRPVNYLVTWNMDIWNMDIWSMGIRDVDIRDVDIVGGGRAKRRIGRRGRCANGNAGSRRWRLNRRSALRWTAAGVAFDVGKHLVGPRYGYDFRLDRKDVVRIGFSQLQCRMHGRSVAQPRRTRNGVAGGSGDVDDPLPGSRVLPGLTKARRRDGEVGALRRVAEPEYSLGNETSGSAVLGKPQHETESFLRLGLWEHRES